MKYTQADVDALNATLGLQQWGYTLHEDEDGGQKLLGWFESGSGCHVTQDCQLAPWSHHVVGAVLDAWSAAGLLFKVGQHPKVDGDIRWCVEIGYPGVDLRNLFAPDILTAVIKANTAWQESKERIGALTERGAGE